MKQLALLCFFLVLTSCGYRFGGSGTLECYRTLAIPFVHGDQKGELTSALISACQKKGRLRYSSCGAEICLLVTVCPPETENIGYTYTAKDEQLTKILASNEGRLTLKAKVIVKEVNCDKVVFGPIEVTDSITFSFEPDQVERSFHSFSLGQLDRHDLAEDSAFNALYARLAERIIDTLYGCW